MKHHVPRRLLILVAVSTLAAAAAPSGAYTVRSGHPRLLMTSETVPMLRTRCQTTHASIYSRIRSEVYRWYQQGASGAYLADDIAFVALMEQDQALINDAISRGLYNATHNLEVRGEGSAPGWVSSTALVYDWLYQYMTPAQRSTIANAMAPGVCSDAPDYLQGSNWLPWDTYFAYPLALWGDGAADACAQQGFDVSYRRFRDRFFPALNQVHPYGSLDGYGGTRTNVMMVYSEMLRSALGEEWTTTNAHLRNTGDFWMHRLRGDYKVIRNPAKWNMAGTDLLVFFAYFAAQMRNPEWQAVANHFLNETQWYAGDGVIDKYLLILWYDPTVPAIAPADTLSYLDTGSGMAYMRSDWNLGPGSTTVHAGFFNGPDTQGHKTQNHFVIARGADNLLIDSGLRSTDIDDHYSGYYSLAVAHNTVLIDDPNEHLGTYTNHLGRTHEIPNEGDQVRSNEPEGCVHWPLACTFGYRGEISAVGPLENRDALNNIIDYKGGMNFVGDATEAYGSKASSVIRQFTYYRPDIFVIRDRIVRANPTFKTKAVFHMIDRPQVAGTYNVVRGQFSTGGIFEYPQTREVTVARGQSECRMVFMDPAAGQGVLRVVGGGNAAGQPWKQNWEPLAPLTYDASTSYEFWVDDRNWISCSSDCYPSTISGRNGEPGNEAGDWRVEIEAPSGSNDVVLTTVVRVGPVGGAGLSVQRFSGQGLEDGLRIIRLPGGASTDTLVVSFAAPGTNEVHY